MANTLCAALCNMQILVRFIEESTFLLEIKNRKRTLFLRGKISNFEVNLDGWGRPNEK